MLKFLNFFKSATGETKLITMRERFDAAHSELNAVLAELPDMPKITIDANSRRIEINAPEQFADEALALPAPASEHVSKENETETVSGDVDAEHSEKSEAEDDAEKSSQEKAA